MAFEDGYSFSDLILGVAEMLDLAEHADSTGDDDDNSARIPTNPSDLGKCKRYVNDGLSLLARDHSRGMALLGKKSSTGWYCLRPIIDFDMDPTGTGPLNLEGDAARYRLPYAVQGAPIGAWTWFATGVQGQIKTAHIDQVRALLTAPSQISGYPNMAAVAPTTPKTAEDRAGWEAMFYPRPSQVLTVSAQFQLAVRPLKALRDYHPFGQIHDQTVLSACRWAASKQESGESERRKEWKADYDEALAASVLIDLNNEPQSFASDPSVRSSACARGVPTQVFMGGVQITP